MDEVVETIRRTDGFVIAGHRDPDGDSVGSSMALALGLEQLGKRSLAVSADPLPPPYRRLPAIERMRVLRDLPPGYPVAVLIECNGTERTGLAGFEGRTIVNIDHHANNPRFADINWIDPGAASVGMMIHGLLKVLGVGITPEIATHLYVTVLTDTGSFRYSNTDPRAFRVCAELLERGVDPAAVASSVYDHVPAAKVRLLGEALARLTLEARGRVAWMWIPHESFVRYPGEPDTEGIIQHAQAVDGVEVAILFKEVEPGRFRVSLRSNGGVDVAAVATGFGGGGHPRAAGCLLVGGLDEVRARILAAVSARLERAG